MAFDSFKYEIMRANIDNLNRTYSTHIGRYSIIEDEDPSTFAKNSLSTLIARANEHVVQCKTDRITARDVFSQLTNEVRPFLESTSDAEIKNAILFLLGALIHRYLRLIQEYKSFNRLNPLSYFYVEPSVRNCKLFLAIEKALKLEKEKLDDVTVVRALEVFKANMMLEVPTTETVGSIKKVVNKPRYMTYLHFFKDPNFESNLNELISDYKDKGRLLLHQFNAIYFLKSLSDELEKERVIIEKEITDWIAALSKGNKDISLLNAEIIKRHMETYFNTKPQHLKNKIADLVAMCFEAETFQLLKDYTGFNNLLMHYSTDQSRCILCGGYVLLQQRGSIEKDLQTIMGKALGLSKELDNENMLGCLNLLEAYLQKEPLPDLDCEFFNGRSLMKKQVSQLSVALQQIQNEQHRQQQVMTM